jgi:hypothetical protein
VVGHLRALDVPALRRGGLGLQVLVELHERVEDVREDLRRGRVGGEARVEVELGAETPSEHLLGGGLAAARAGALVVAVVAATAGQRKAGDGRDERRQQPVLALVHSVGPSWAITER